MMLPLFDEKDLLLAALVIFGCLGWPLLLALLFAKARGKQLLVALPLLYLGAVSPFIYMFAAEDADFTPSFIAIFVLPLILALIIREAVRPQRLNPPSNGSS